MDKSVTYDKVYFHDDYRHQFEELRDIYRERTQRALKGRAVDHNPVPNATTIVYLHDSEDGGFHITTGDFVEYFNRRYGDNDRIGAMRRSLAVAEKRAEMSNEYTKRQRVAEVKQREQSGFAHRVRSSGRRFAFVHAVFALMLVLSVTMLCGSAMVLDRVDSQLAALEEQFTVSDNTANGTETAFLAENAARLSLSGTDSVEIYPAEDAGSIEMSALLNALAGLGGK